MKRDMKLCKEILVQTENHFSQRGEPVSIQVEGYSDDEIGYHIYLLAQAGMIEVLDFTSMVNAWSWRAQSLTWAGHDFLDSIRDG